MGYFEKFGYGSPRLDLSPPKDLHIAVVIPVYNDPGVIKALQSLFDCDPAHSCTEVIIVVNASADSPSEIKLQNKKTLIEIEKWKSNNYRKGFYVHAIEEQHMPPKHSGVGLARKIGMDEAAYRFNLINRSGIIVCFDADCICDKNYLTEIESQFSNGNVNGASVYFEHPLSGNEFSAEVYNAITNYELFLRYYIEGLRYAGYPYAFHTIGSSMAVRSSVYQKQGGMNKRKAGEDFYFLHKVIPLGNFIEINTTRVVASPRPSDRVPFGTGRAVNKWIENKKDTYTAYSMDIFEDLKCLFASVHGLFAGDIRYEQMPASLKAFLIREEFENKITEIQNNSTSVNAFVKRFYSWWDGFLVLKFVHYARDHFYPDKPIISQLEKIFPLNINLPVKEHLLLLRGVQRKKPREIRGAFPPVSK